MAPSITDLGSEALGRLAEMSAAIREATKAFALGKIAAFYTEVERAIATFDTKKRLDYRPGAIAMSFQNDHATAAADGVCADYGVSSDEDFVVYDLRGLLTFDAWDTETAIVAATLGDAAGDVDPIGRAYVKSSNVRVNLKDSDLSGVQVAGELEDLPLCSILGEVGGRPMKFGGEDRPSWILPHGHHPKAKVTFQSTAAGVLGGKSSYGVILTGVFLKRARR